MKLTNNHTTWIIMFVTMLVVGENDVNATKPPRNRHLATCTEEKKVKIVTFCINGSDE